MSHTFLHDPDAVLPYEWDWRAWLLHEDADVISGTPTITQDPADSLEIETPTVEDGVVSAVISGGVVPVDVEVTCHIVTVGGREDDRTIKLKVRHR